MSRIVKPKGWKKPSAKDLRLGSNGNIHCWYPDQHKNGVIAPPYRVGHEQPIEMLVRSGLWARLCIHAQRMGKWK